MVQPVSCVICEKHEPHGLFLLDRYICPHCERQMVNTEADEPAYDVFVQRLKKVCWPAGSGNRR